MQKGNGATPFLWLHRLLHKKHPYDAVAKCFFPRCVLESKLPDKGILKDQMQRKLIKQYKRAENSAVNRKAIELFLCNQTKHEANGKKAGNHRTEHAENRGKNEDFACSVTHHVISLIYNGTQNRRDRHKKRKP